MVRATRTTVNLDFSILENARVAAASRGVTMSELLEDALRSYLSPTNQAPAPPFHLHTVRGCLVQPELNLDRSSALVVADDESAHNNSV